MLVHRLPRHALLATTLLVGVLGPSVGNAQSDPANDVDEFLAYVTKPYETTTFTEKVDPHSGYLHINMVDIRLPGKAGLDLLVQRYYSSNIWRRVDYENMWDVSTHTPFYDGRDNMGSSGWQIHMGKVIDPAGLGSPSLLRDNPVVVMPDGSFHKLYSASSGGGMISPERWRYRAVTGGWELTTTDGLVYRFEAGAAVGYYDYHGELVAQCTRVTDPNGNSITIQYNASKLYQITDTLGRIVEFTYSSDGMRVEFVRVKSGTQTLQTFEYRYQLQATINQPTSTGWANRNIYALTQVCPPETTTSGLGAWNFEYHPQTNSKGQGKFCLKKVTFPSGGTITYTYKPTTYEVGLEVCQIPFCTVDTRVQAGRGVTSGTWSYQYSSPGTNSARTTVTGPNSHTEQYDFDGWEPYTTDDPNMWRVGLLKQSVITDSTLQTVTETYQWAQGDLLSFDWEQTTNWVGCGSGRLWREVKFVKPIQVARSVVRNGRTYTSTQAQFDAYGNPVTVTDSGHLTRTTALTYWYNSARNMLRGKVLSRTLSPGGAESFGYDDYGRMTRRTVNTITTTYAYDATGQLTKETDANTLSTYYKNYTYGVPAWVDPPLSGVDYYREVSPLSLVTTETDGRAGSASSEPRTRYEYDGLKRITKVNPPGTSSLFADILVDYADDGASAHASQSQYDVTYDYDGVGRLTKVTDELGHSRQTTYNALGSRTRKSFTYGTLQGDIVDYDLLGRLSVITHPDASTVGYTYGNGTVAVRNERNHTTTYSYDGFSSPEDSRLKTVLDSAGKTTTYLYDAKNLLTTVDSPGTTADRTFAYNTKYLLDSETHPESGVTRYGYDGAGRRTSVVRGSQTTIYSFDNLNRLTFINHPDTAPDATFDYDKAGHRTELSSTAAVIEYEYDDPGRLIHTSLQASGRTLTTSYDYDNVGNLTTVTYPSNRVVTYQYNTKRQVTAVPGYMSSATYHQTGTVNTLAFANNVSATIGLDSRYRISSILAGTSGSVLDLDFSYDVASNMTDQDDNRPPVTNRDFQYDSLARLTSASGPWGSTTFTYDTNGLGNRSTMTAAGTTTTYTYTSNRLTGYTTPGGRSASFTYDTLGRMSSRTITDSGLREGGEPEPSPDPAPEPGAPDGGDSDRSTAPLCQEGNLTRSLGLRARAGDRRVTLSWVAHPDLALEGLQVRRGSGGCPEGLDDGVAVCDDVAGRCVDETAENGVPYCYNVFMPAAGEDHPTAAAWATPDASLVAFLPFSEGAGDATEDVSGHGHHGQLEGTEWVRGTDGPAVAFGGEGTLAVAPSPALAAGAAGLTLEAWVELDTLPVGTATVALAGPLSLEVDDEGRLLARMACAMGHTEVTSASPLEPWVFYHAAAVWDAASATLRLVVDGVRQDERPCVGALSTRPGALRVGAGERRWSSLPGTVDELRVYRRGLSDEELLRHALGERYAALVERGEPHPAVKAGSSPLPRSAVDGRRALPAELSAGRFPGGFSVELWLGPDLAAGEATLVDLGGVRLALSGGTLVASVQSHGAVRQLQATLDPEVERGRHVAVILDPVSTLALYLDGELVASEAAAGPPDPCGRSPEAGASEAGLSAEVDRFALVPRPLTPAEVARDARAAR